MHIQWEIPRRLGNGPKALTYNNNNNTLSNNLALTSYLSGIYLESWFSWLLGGVQKTSKKRRKQTEGKHWKTKRKKNEEYEESQITTKYISGFKLYFARKHNLKKVVCGIKFYLQFSCIAGYLKHSNDTRNLNMHKYTNYNIIEIYINRLSTTTQIFIAMDYLIMMSENYRYFRKRKKHLARTFFTHPTEVTGFMYSGNIFRIMCLPETCTKT